MIMSLGLVFWILMLLWVVVHGVVMFRTTTWADAPSLFPFLLLLILGWKVFGAPVNP